MDSQQTRANLFGVDVVRGVAILMVVGYHAFGSARGWWVPWAGSTRDFGAATNQIAIWQYPITLGWVGVPLFFVISGFCIHYSFLRSGEFNGRQFFWRRFWRIYPAYIVAVIVFSLTRLAELWPPMSGLQVVSHALFFHNATFETFFGINSSFWSIAVEVQLYLLFPVLLLVSAKLGLHKTLAVLFVVGCAWRAGTAWLAPIPDHVITPAWTSPLLSWFDWALGAFVAERFVSGRRTFGRPAAWLAALLPLFIASTLWKPATTFSFTLAAAASAVALDIALHHEWRKGWLVRGVAFVGTISYSMYLWHQPLLVPLVALGTSLFGSTVAAWATVASVILVVSWLSNLVLERPGIAVGRTLWNRFTAGARTGALSTADRPATSEETQRSAA